MVALSPAELRKRNNFTLFVNRIKTNGYFTINESNGQRVQITQRFGYQLQRGLLLEVAMQANGSFGHIPDGSMIATNFCNYAATILLTICSNIQIHIKMEDGSSPPIDIINGSTILRSQKDISVPYLC